jgi:hypothetical protein
MPGTRVSQWRTAALLSCWAAAWLVFTVPPAARAAPGRPAAGPRGGGESQIDESAPDESAPAAVRQEGAAALPGRVREYVEGSLARYDALKNASVSFRRRGWFPSFFLREPERDVAFEPGAGGGMALTVHLSFARRDPEQRLVVGPVDRFELPGADKRFFAELIGALATLAPEIGHARIEFWFAALRADGQMTWESRGRIGLSAAAARGIPAGQRTAQAVWPLLDENTLPPSIWDGL